MAGIPRKVEPGLNGAMSVKEKRCKNSVDEEISALG